MKLSELSRLLEICGFANRTKGQEDHGLIGVNTPSDAGKGERSFLTNSNYREPLRDVRALAATVDLTEPAPVDWSALRCPNPHGAVAAAIKLIHGTRMRPAGGRVPRAIVADSARIGAGAHGRPALLSGE